MPRKKIERPYWFLDDDLVNLFGYAYVVNARYAITHGTFPIPTYKIGRFHAADKAVVARYFKEIRFEQLELYEQYKSEGRYYIGNRRNEKHKEQ